jgi:hypothetical protein
MNPVLREIQRQFMQGVLYGDGVPGLLPPAAISIYANNARVNFTQTLALAYPAIRRLVGDDYFRQCAREFQRIQPSRSGDLQHVGKNFAGHLAALHGAGTFSYLADVARLEWAYQEALIETEFVPLDLSRLAQVEPQQYLDLRFCLQPSARLVESAFPILAIWAANVVDGATDDERIDLNAGADRLLLVRAFNHVRIHRLSSGELTFLRRLRVRERFGAAVACAADADSGFDPAASLRRFVALHTIVDFHL